MLRSQLLRQQRSLLQSIPRSIQLSRSQHSCPRPSLSASPVILPPRIARRWQSTQAETKPGEEQQTTSSQAAKSEKTQNGDDPTSKELEEKKKEVIDLKDKYLRSVADYRNLQERTRRDMEAARAFAIQRFATDLLDSIDNLDRALSAVPAAALSSTDSPDTTTANTSSSDANQAAAAESTAPNQDLVNLHSGLKMTEQVLMATLKKHGLERFDPLEGEGRKFDPNQDEATFFSRQEGKEDGDVFYVQSKGFKLNGRVIRAAKVGVVKNS